MAKPNFTLPNKPAIKSGSILSYNYTDDFTFVPAPLTFNRDSAATLVNSQGLIEEVGYFGPELVQNGNFNKNLQPNEIVDQDSLPLTGWSRIGSVYSAVNASSNVALNYLNGNSFNYSTGDLVEISFTISDYVQGTVNIQVSGGGSASYTPIVSANGTYTFTLNLTGNNTQAAILSGGSSPTLKVSNVSFRKLQTYWTFGTGWSMGDGKAVKTSGTGSSLVQAVPVTTIGKKYKFTFDAIVTSGVINATIYGITIPTFTTSGSQEHTITATSTSGFNFYGNAFFEGSITNVSVIEVLGDKPRIDYSDSLTEPSLLLEPQSTNLLPYSEDFTTYSKSTDLDIESNTQETLSPEGIYNSSKFTATGSDPYIYKFGINVTTNTQTISLYVKGVGNSIGKEGRILFWYIGTATGTTLSVPFTLTSDWQRVEGSSTPTGSGTIAARVDLPANTSVVGDEAYIYGFQLEELPYATSYIPTAGSTATRLGETANNAGDVNVFNSEEGVLYAEIAALANDGTNRKIAIGSSTNRIIFGYRTGSNNVRVEIISSGSVVFDNSQTINNITTFNKFAVKYKQNDFSLWINSQKVSIDTSGNTPIGLSEFAFDDGSTNLFYGKVRNVQVFNKALTDRELEILTIQ